MVLQFINTLNNIIRTKYFNSIYALLTYRIPLEITMGEM
jgi:hypothetical protein